MRGWRDTTIPWDPRPCPSTLVQGRGGALKSVKGGGGEKAPLPPWVWSQKSLSLQLTLGWGGSDASPFRGCWGMTSPKEQQVFSESL